MNIISNSDNSIICQCQYYFNSQLNLLLLFPQIIVNKSKNNRRNVRIAEAVLNFNFDKLLRSKILREKVSELYIYSAPEKKRQVDVKISLTALVVHAEWPTDRIELTTLNTESSRTDNVGCSYVHIFPVVLVSRPRTNTTVTEY